TLTFAGTAGTQTITVNTTSDTKVEANETLNVTLSSLAAQDPTVPGTPGGTLTIGTATGTGTINNDDSATVSINSVSVTEGGALLFVVTLSADVQGGATVNFASSDATATVADSDYTGVSGTLTFAGTAGTQTITVNTTSDTKVEANETLNVTLSSLAALGAGVPGGPGGTLTIGTATGTGTINNDDSATVSINS